MRSWLGLQVILPCFLLVIGCVFGDSTTETLPTTTAEPTTIQLKHRESTTSSIEVEWYVPTFMRDSVSTYIIQSNKKDSEVIITSPSLNDTMFLIEDLRSNMEYTVCLHVTDIDGNDGDEVCEQFETIPFIRLSSIYGMIASLGYILLMILLGYIFWRCKMNELQKAEDEEELDPDSVNEKDKLAPNNEPIVYLASPPRPGQRSSIEDPDIPYITPPVEKLTPSEREKFFANTTRV